MTRPPDIACLGTPTFCHGIGGVLQIAARMAVETADTRVAALVPQLCADLLGFYDPTTEFGFRALGPNGMRGDDAGFSEWGSRYRTCVVVQFPLAGSRLGSCGSPLMRA